MINDLLKGAIPQSVHTEEWLSWYRGEVFGFHNYRVYNGTNYLEMRRKTLQMAKKICEDWANVLFNERCTITVDNNEVLQEVLNNTNFWVKANEAVEKSFALGYGALVVNVVGLRVGEVTGRVDKSSAKVEVDFVNKMKCYPLTVHNKQVIECGFVARNSDGTNVSIHRINARGNYVIHNYVLDTSERVIEQYEFDTLSPLPWFQIIRPNISSNILSVGMDEEIGISIFANSIDTLKAIDNKYDGFDLEYVLGRKRMFISSEAWTVNKVDGEMIRTFDPYDVLFYHLPDNDDGKPLVTNKSDDLRYDAYIKGINAELSYLASKCGMGENYYKFDGSAIATATQVISENSTLYRSIKKHELLLEGVLRGIIKAVIYASNTFTDNPIGDDAVVIKFDDSIIEDKETEMQRDRLDVASGIMSKVEYRMKWYGEDEETASGKVDELYDRLNRYMPALSNGAITPEIFVEQVYGEGHQDVVDYIKEFLASGKQLDVEAIYSGNN
ncbi:MAG TPA: phage portal protein [Paludibacteraceae bacterium]|nr:phage portal protein [Paludibacteraceae bacterium]